MWFRKSVGATPLILLVLIYTIAYPCCLYALSQPYKVVKPKYSAQKPTTVADQKVAVVAPAVEKYLLQGQLGAGEEALTAELKKHPHNDQLRFGLGSLQFLRAVEKMSQSQYRYGVGSGTISKFDHLPHINSPFTVNPNPEILSYQEAQNIAKTFVEDLGKAEATLASITAADVKLPLHFGMIRLDLNGDGQVNEDESLWRLYAALDRTKNISPDTAKDFYISFDRGDVNWLRGYCHLMMGVGEIYLAHDTKEMFDCTAQLFFDKINSPYKFLSESNAQLHGQDAILDLIALIHLIDWPVSEPERMKAALHHFEAVTEQSKESWRWIMAEKDNDHEWLPNPEQTGVIPNVRVTQEMVDTWLSLMDQSAKILAGDKLVPFWRGHDGYGVNFRKMFTEPKTFDLVLFLQGPGAAPYLQKGDLTEAGTVVKLQRAFGGQFPGFALWFN